MASINKKNLALGDKSKFQLVLVGYDQEKSGNEAYLKKVNFPGLKLKGREGVQKLLQTGETGFIPNVVLLKPDGSLISNDRNTVIAKLTELVKE